MKSRVLILVCILICCATSALAEEAGPPKIPGLVEGPIKVSPWFVASQPKPSATRDHYMFSVPPLLYYGFYGWPAYGYSFGGYYGVSWYGYSTYRPSTRISPYRYYYP